MADPFDTPNALVDLFRPTAPPTSTAPPTDLFAFGDPFGIRSPLDVASQPLIEEVPEPGIPELPGILETSVESIKFGFKTSLADAVDFFGTSQEFSPGVRLRAAQKADQMRQKAIGEVSERYLNLLGTERSVSPLLHTVKDVATQLPLFATAVGTTLATKNPFAGGAAFTPTIWTSFFNEAINSIDSNTGLPVTASKARMLANVNNMFAFITESAIPQTGFLKGGFIAKRFLRGSLQEGLIEEGIQGTFETTLKTLGYREPKNLARDIADEVPPQIIAGAILGGAAGAVSPSNISNLTRDEFKKRARKRLDKNNADEVKKGQPNKPASEVQKAEDAIMSVYDIKEQFRKEFDPENIPGNVKEDSSILDGIGFVEVIKDGVKTVVPSPWGLPSDKGGFTKEEKALAQNFAQDAITNVSFGLNKDRTYKFKDLPGNVQQLVKTKAAEMVSEGLDPEVITGELVKMYEEIGELKNVFLVPIGKEQGDKVSITAPVFTFALGSTSVKEVADELKLTQPERGKPFSIQPKNVILYSNNTVQEIEREARGETVSAIEGIHKALVDAYNKSDRAEILPPDEQEPGEGLGDITVDPTIPVQPVTGVDQSVALQQAEQEIITKLSNLIASGTATVENISAIGYGKILSPFIANQISFLKPISEQMGAGAMAGYVDSISSRWVLTKEAVNEIALSITTGNLPPTFFPSIPDIRPKTEAAISNYNDTLVELEGIIEGLSEEQLKGLPQAEPDYLEGVAKSMAWGIIEESPSIEFPGLSGIVHNMMIYPQIVGHGLFPAVAAELADYLNTPNLNTIIGNEKVFELKIFASAMDGWVKENVPENTNLQAMEAINKELNPDQSKADERTVPGYSNDNDVTLTSERSLILTRIQAIRDVITTLIDKGVALTINTPGGSRILSNDPTLARLLTLHEFNWQQLTATGLSTKYINSLRTQLSSKQLTGLMVDRELSQDAWHDALATFIKDGRPIVGFTSDIPINVIAVEPPAGETQGVAAGKVVSLSGPYVVDTTKTQPEGKVLIKNGDFVWVTPAQLSKIINMSNLFADQLGIEAPIKTQFMGDQNIAMGGKPPPKPPDAPSGGFDGDFEDEHQKGNYDQFKATGDQDANDPTEIPGDPRILPLRSFFKAIGFLKFPSMVKRYLNNVFGQSKEAEFRETEKQKRKQMSLNDQVLEHLFGDRFFRDLADTLAVSQLNPLRNKLESIVRERLAPKILGPEAKNADIKKLDSTIQNIFQFASEEIFSKQGFANAYSVTDIGAGGQHLSPEEAQAHLNWMQKFHEALGIPFDINTQNQWLVQRDPLSFFNLLGQLDPELQSMLTYYKAEIEYPVLEAGLKVGLFKSANMWANISRGFMHRLAPKSALQESFSFGGPSSVVNSPNIQGQNFRTMGEFADATEGFGLLPELGFFAAARDYITDYVTYIHQAQSAQSIKGILANNPFTLRDYTPKDDAEATVVDDLTSQTAMVEYTTSNTINKLANISGQTEEKILTDLGYIQDKRTPGFAVWAGGTFQQPWVFAPLSDALRSIFEPSNTPNALRKTNAVFNFGKRFLTYNPYDATFLWLSAVLVNSNPTELAKLFTDYTKLVVTDLPFVGKTGRSILRGEFYPVGDLDLTKYENLPEMIAAGFTAFGYQPAMAAQWDDYQLGKFPTDLTSGERISEYFKSFGGVNAAIFNTLVAQKLYHVANKFYEKNLQKTDPFTGDLMTKKKAMRLAVSAINDFSFLVHPAVYGKKEGPIKTLFLFTRGLTIGFMRQLTLGGLYPLLPKVARKKLFKFRTEGMGTYLNDVFHGEKSQVDMALLAPQYTLHIAKVFSLGLLLNGMVQFGLSFMDDDERDEHGEIANGDLNARKRWMWLNEPGKRFSVRLPNQYISIRDGRRTYLNFQMLREASHIGKIVFDQLEQDGIKGQGFPQQTLAWGFNRLNFGIGIISDWARNEDRSTGQPIWNRNSSSADKAEDFSDWIREEFKPLGFGIIGRGFEKVPGIRDSAIPDFFIRRGEDIRTAEEANDITLNLLEFFGGTTRKGEEFQAGFTIKDLKELQKAKVETDINARRNRKARLEGADPATLLGFDTGLTPTAAKQAFIQEVAPVASQLLRNKRAIMRERLFQDRPGLKAKFRKKAKEKRKEAIKKGRARRKQKQ